MFNILRSPWHTSPRPRTVRLTLESLEDRCLLAAAVGSGYLQTNLVSDQAGEAQFQDPNLVNAWGIGLNPNGGGFWVANNATGVATIYSGAVNGQPLQKNPLVVNIAEIAPTGQVFNGTTDFVIHSGNASGPARFIFTSESGFISAWNSAVPPSSTTAINQAGIPNAIFKGITLGNNGQGNFLYTADFHNGVIDVFDKNFMQTTLSGSFTDPAVPAGFAPFNIQNLGGKLYVTYAKQDADQVDEVAGPGLGFVSVFDTNGNLLQHLVSNGPLNAPWGLVLAPASFGQFSNDLLVGNFGDGHISAFDPDTGDFKGQLSDPSGQPISIDGLWGLTFGNGVSAGGKDVLFFTAGPDDETHGLFGSLQVAGTPSDQFVSQLYRDLLNREPDAEGLAFYSNLLDQGKLDRLQTALAIESSPEFKNLVVTDDYEEVLRREPDPAERTAALQFLNQGGTEAGLEVRLLATPEYFANRGGSTNAGFVQAVYEDVLGRSASANEVQAWTQLLDQGTSRTTVAQGIVFSKESLTGAVERRYDKLLNRSADTAGLNAWVAALEGGMSLEQVTAFFTASPEYFGDITHGVHVRYVGQLFHDLLGRTVDSTGLAFYVGLLDQGSTTPLQVVQSIEHSTEFETRLVQLVYQQYLGRSASTAELAAPVAFLAGGGTFNQLAIIVTSSPEYFQKAGGTNDGFLSALYEDALDRPIDDTARAAFTQALAGGMTRSQVAAIIFSSDEYRRDEVNGIYEEFLGRPADTAGLNLAVDFLLNGGTGRQLIAILVSSPEYFSHI